MIDIPQNSLDAFVLSLVTNTDEQNVSCSDLLKQLDPGHIEALRAGRIDSVLYQRISPLPLAQQIYERVWAFQKEVLIDLLAKFEERSIEFMTYKGAENIERDFNSRPLNLMFDIDILVKEDQLPAAKGLLKELGYVQADLNTETLQLVERSPEDLEVYEASSYELYAFSKVFPFSFSDSELKERSNWCQPPLWTKDGNGVLLFSVDVHKSVSNDLLPEPFWQRAQPSQFNIGQAISPEDQLWVTALKYYFELAVHGQMVKKRDLAYIAKIMARENLDWDIILGAAKDLDIRPALYYVLSYLSHLCNVQVPDAVLTNLNPALGSRVRDFGWQLHKLFDEVPPMPTGAISKARVIKSKLGG